MESFSFEAYLIDYEAQIFDIVVQMAIDWTIDIRTITVPALEWTYNSTVQVDIQEEVNMDARSYV